MELSEKKIEAMPYYFTVQDVAEILSLNPQTVRRYIREGKLKSKKIGAGHRITKEDLQAFINNQ